MTAKTVFGIAAALAALSAAAASGAADAAIMVATITGNVTGNDITGMFGPAGRFDGAPLTISFTYDTAAGRPTSSAGATGREGGTRYAVANPIQSVTLNFNGSARTISSNPDNESAIEQYANGTLRFVSDDINSPRDGYSLVAQRFIFSVSGLPTGQSLLDRAGSFSGLSLNPYVFILYSTPQTFGVERFEVSSGSTASLTIKAATPAEPPAVPEPATWAMMIAGFGAIGVSMRRRPIVARSDMLRSASPSTLVRQRFP